MKKLLLSTALSIALVYPAVAEEVVVIGQGGQEVIEPSSGETHDAVEKAVEHMEEAGHDVVEKVDEVKHVAADHAAESKMEEKIVEKVEAHAPSHASWGYVGGGAAPYWGTLDEGYHACAQGQAQSPINIAKFLQEDLPSIEASYNASPLSVVNNGHTIQVNFQEGSSFSAGNVNYNLLQAHFHTPSEHYLDGAPYPMEVHFVHKAADGTLGVIGVMMKVGAHNKVIEGVWQNAPINSGGEKNVGHVEINAKDLLPASLEYYKYSGSLTTPPCSEGVQWHVMKDPIEVSEKQLKAFQALFPVNARPVQSLNDRVVTGD